MPSDLNTDWASSEENTPDEPIPYKQTVFAAYGRALVTAKTEARLTNHAHTHTPWTREVSQRVRAKDVKAKAKEKARGKERARKAKARVKVNPEKERAKESTAEQMLRPNGPRSKDGRRPNGPRGQLRLPSHKRRHH